MSPLPAMQLPSLLLAIAAVVAGCLCAVSPCTAVPAGGVALGCPHCTTGGLRLAGLWVCGRASQSRWCPWMANVTPIATTGNVGCCALPCLSHIQTRRWHFLVSGGGWGFGRKEYQSGRGGGVVVGRGGMGGDFGATIYL